MTCSGWCRWLAVGLALGVRAHATVIEVRLVDLAGHPAPDAIVVVAPSSRSANWSEQRLRTNGTGAIRAECSLDDRGEAVLYARVADTAALASWSTRSPVDVLRLAPLRRDDGLVVDEHSQPVAGATIGLTSTEGGSLPSVQSDAAGRWHAAFAPAEAPVEYVVTAPGRAMAWLRPGRLAEPSPQSIAVLPPACTLRGRLLRPDGRPAAGVRVNWTTTAADGTWCLDRLSERSGFIYVDPSAGSGMARLRRTDIPLHPAAETVLPDIRLEAAFAVSITVVRDDTGAPVVGRWLHIGRGREYGANVRTDAGGHARVELAQGTWRLTLDSAANLDDTVAERKVDVVPGGVELTWKVPDRPAVNAVVHVVDAAAQPVAGAEVITRFRRALEQTQRTDGRGCVAVLCRDRPWSPPDPPLVTVMTLHPLRRGSVKVEPLAVAGEWTVLLEAVPSQTLTGRVVNDAGQAVPHVPLDIWAGSAEPDNGGTAAPVVAMPGQTVTSDAMGRWSLADVPLDVDVTVAARVAGRLPCLRLTTIERHGTAQTLPNLVVATGKLNGTVVDDAGRPVADATVFVEGACDGLAPTTDAAGRFDVEHVPARDVAVVAISGRRQWARAMAAPGAGPLRLVLRQADPAPWPDDASSKERDLAAKLAAEALAQVMAGDETELGAVAARLLAMADWDRAVDTASAAPHPWRSVLIPAIAADYPHGMPLDETAFALLEAEPDGAGRLQAASMMALRAGRLPADAAARLWTVANARRKADDGLWGSVGAAAAYALALHLGRPEAATRLTELKQNYRDDRRELGWMLADCGRLGGVDTAVWGELVPFLGANAERIQPAYLAALARTDPLAAARQLRLWWLKPDGGLNTSDASALEAVARVAAALAAAGRDDDAAELQQPSLWSEHGGLPASRAHTAAVARRLLGCPPDSPSVEGYPTPGAALIFERLDPVDTALQYGLARAEPMIADLDLGPLLRHDKDQPWEQAAIHAYGLSRADPNRVRWTVEAMVARLPQALVSAETTGALITAMAAVDVSRAAALARSLSDPARSAAARLTLAQWLLAPGWAKRCWPSMAYHGLRLAEPWYEVD